MTFTVLSNTLQPTILPMIQISSMFLNPLKKIQKYMNLDLRFVCNWLKANKISLNASKTEMLVFRDPRRIFKKQEPFSLLRKILNITFSISTEVNRKTVEIALITPVEAAETVLITEPMIINVGGKM